MSLKWLSVVVISGTLALAGRIAAQTSGSVNLTGSWELDSAKSHLADGRTLALVIVHKGDAIKLDGEVDKAGTKSELHFDCKMDGSDCEFTEGTHKSKMSVWIVSGTVTACKTNGPPGDASTEWHMKVSSDGNTMTVDVEHVDPTAAAESMVFTKKPA